MHLQAPQVERTEVSEVKQGTPQDETLVKDESELAQSLQNLKDTELRELLKM